MSAHMNEKIWDSYSLEKKVEELHGDIAKLYNIDEEFGHKNHIFVDAIGLVHSRLDGLAKAIEKLEKRIKAFEMADY